LYSILHRIMDLTNETALKVIFGSFNIFIFSCIKIYHNKNNKKMSGKSNIKVSDLNIPAAEEEKQNR
ncbi:hypothetical protein, partial [Enterococcus faecium]|uniref:hypothetical protein n=1 Tax=Enterococcus faecium TaxID=1352 RepID=UPI001CEDFCB9